MTPDLLGDRYRLLDVLGRGGFAVVHRALDTVTGRTVAVKLATVGDDAAKHQLRVEATVLTRLHHPAVPALIDVQLESTLPFIVIELRGDRNLGDDLTLGPIGARRMNEVLGPVIDCLEQAHALGIVHRDLTPANIVVDSRGRGSLTDFGNAATIGAAPPTNANGGLTLTPRWAAPEMSSSAPVTAANDVYSMALIIAACLGAMQTVDRDTSPTGPVDLARLDARWRSVISAAIDIDPNRRPAITGLDPRAPGTDALGDATVAVEPILAPTAVQVDRTAVLPPPGDAVGTAAVVNTGPRPSLTTQLHAHSRRRRWLAGSIITLLAITLAGIILARREANAPQNPGLAPVTSPPSATSATSPATSATSATSVATITTVPTPATTTITPIPPTTSRKGNGNGNGKGKGKGKG
ncbi:MAG: serine/threonine-protein kinase [Ilumatobacteraceae bacterium]